MCVYIYIYIERERDVCGWVCVCSWMDSQRRDLIFGIFDRHQCIWMEPFVYFGAKTTQRAVPTKTCEAGCNGRKTSASREWDSGALSQDTEQWRDESEYLVAVKDFRWVLAIAMNIHTENAKVPTSLSCVCSSKSVFGCFLFPPSVLFDFYFYFCTTCEMPTQPGVRRNNGLHTTRRTARSTKPGVCGYF